MSFSPRSIGIALFILVCYCNAKSQTLSDSSSISVLTMGPYQPELYSAFGHSAIRIHDPVNNWDIVYNYGIFDFDQPNFYLNFARGRLYYMLGLQRYDRFERHYISENRTIIEQVLNLDSTKRQELFEFLQWNAQPENRNYYYNYIYDNCATRIRDVVDSLFVGQIKYDYSYVNEDLTFRDLMDLYLAEQPWGDLGIDVCLGIGIDKTASGYNYMYLPDYIERAFDGATIQRNDTVMSLVKEKRVVYRSTPEQSAASNITPTMIFVSIFFVFGFISFRDLKFGRRTKWIDILLFSIAGTIGWLLLFLWFLTDHISSYNFNLLWAFPFHLPIVFFLFKKPDKSFLKPYFLANAIILCALITFWGFWPQDLHDSLIPFVLILLIRAVVIVKSLKEIERKKEMVKAE